MKNDYVVEISECYTKFQSKVLARMNEGYTVQGGVQVVNFPAVSLPGFYQAQTIKFFQAMVKYEEP